MEWLGDFFNGFMNDIYQLFVQFSAWITIKLTIAWFETKIWFLQYSWDVAREILLNLKFSDYLASYFNMLPESVRGILLYLQFDKGIAMMAQAFVAAFFFSRVA